MNQIVHSQALGLRVSLVSLVFMFPPCGLFIRMLGRLQYHYPQVGKAYLKPRKNHEYSIIIVHDMKMCMFYSMTAKLQTVLGLIEAAVAS